MEAGELYHELRGVSLECEVTIHRDSDRVAELGLEIFTRYASPRGRAARREPAARRSPRWWPAQARKRVALEFCERHRASWDHGKLGGVY